MDFDGLKKLIWIMVIVIAAGWYVGTHYTFGDVLKYSHDHPNEKYSPMMDYYSGMAYYMRDDHDGSIAAFQQLLADYPTCQYAPTAILRLGTSYIEKNRYQDARELWDKYLEEYPNDKNRKMVQDKYEYIKFR